MGDKQRIGIYVRISDDREGRELGIDRQEDDCRALLRRLYDTKVADAAAVYPENDRGASARSRKPRPKYSQMLADARAGRINHIVAYTTSRLTRRPLEHEALIELAERHGVTYDYVRSPSFDLNTAAGRRVARILAATDAGEAEELGERVARSMVQIAEEGGYRGGPRPFGFERDGVTVRPDEAAALRDAAERVLAGESIKSIAREWSEARLPRASWHPPLKVTPWRSTDITSALRRPRNAGLIDHDGEIIGPAKWPSLFDDDRDVAETKWRAVVTKLSDQSRLNNNGNEPRWMGSLLYVCAGCERPTLRVSMSGNRKPSYRCSGEFPAINGRHVTRAALPLDAFVEWSVVSYLDQHRDLFVAPRPDLDIKGLHAELLSLQRRLRDFEDMLGDGELNRAGYNRQVARVTAQLTPIQEKLTAAGSVDPVSQLLAAHDVVAAWFGEGPERVGGLSLARRRAVLKRVAQVTVHPQGPGPFRPGAVEIVMPPPA